MTSTKKPMSLIDVLRVVVEELEGDYFDRVHHHTSEDRTRWLRVVEARKALTDLDLLPHKPRERRDAQVATVLEGTRVERWGEDVSHTAGSCPGWRVVPYTVEEVKTALALWESHGRPGEIR